MRISPEIQQYFRIARQNEDDKVFLFGSRTDDSKLGGDIDVFILSNERYNSSIIRNIKAEFMQKFGWQKLDLISWTFDEKNTFKDLVMDEAIEL
ncbi:MAG: nucleotidyltransferase domain-containing protein [Gammaproteobacteria bacterium]|nr:nucleotidyltransferase domain-containing protein [Gammaproteobacteria bacterium]